MTSPATRCLAQHCNHTKHHVRNTLRRTLLLFIAALLLQLPMLAMYSSQNVLAWLNWISHLLCLLGITVKLHRLTLHAVKIALFTLYYSYLCWSVYLWPTVFNTHYFFLLAVVVAGFVFTRQERTTQIYLLTGALLLFLLTGLFNALKLKQSGQLLMANDVTLVALSLALYVVYRKQVISRWHGLNQAHRNSLSTLQQLIPQHPDSPELFWSVGQTRKYPSVCVLFADLHGYTLLTRSFGDDKMVATLSRIYAAIDSLLAHYHIEKIKTNGDQYIAVGGLSSSSDNTSCEEMIKFAIALRRTVRRLNRHTHTDCSIRIGISTGPLTAGIVGQQKPYFDIWGKTVNLAAYLEQIAHEDSISLCPVTAKALKPPLLLKKRKVKSHKHPELEHYFELSC